jgi:hypothetical protein
VAIIPEAMPGRLRVEYWRRSLERPPLQAADLSREDVMRLRLELRAMDRRLRDVRR